MISIGVGFLVPILSVLIAVAGNFHSEEDAFVLAIIVYILTWLVYFITRLNSRRSLAAGIALNLVTVTTPLLGWFIAEWWIEIYKNQHYNYDQIDWHLVDEVRFYGEVIGMLTFLILLQPVFKRFYVNWYSKPEE
jgi:predicted PurR-regulated permease PerM